MTEDDAAAQPHTEARAVLSMTVGARLSLVASLLLLIVAAYLFWGPIGHDVANGFPANCGSAAKPPHDTLGKAVCGSVNDVRLAQAVSALAAAIVVAIGGLFSFGFTRVVTRHTRTAP